MSTATAPQGTDGLTPTARQTLTAVRHFSGEWVAIRHLLAAPDAPPVAPDTMRTHLRQLVARGLVEAQGENGYRVYRAPEGSGLGAQWGSSQVSPTATVIPTKRSPTVNMAVVRARLLDHLSRRRMDAMSIEQGLNLAGRVVADVLGELVAEGLVRRRPDGRYEATA